MATTKDRVQKREGRFYNIPDVGQLPSVTTILQVIGKPALVAWSAKVERELVLKASADLYEDIAKCPPMSRAGWITTMQSRMGKEKAHAKELAKAGDIGSQVHDLIEWTLKGQLMYEVGPSPRICDAAQWAFMAWEDWKKTVNLKPLFVEQVVYSPTYGYAGTLDLLAEVNGVLTVIDWKSGKAVYSESHLQNAAYRQAIRELGHGDPKQGLIVRLPKNTDDPEFEVVEAKSEESQFPKFLNALQLWTWAQAMDAEYQDAKKPKDEATPDSQIIPLLQKSIEQGEARK